MFLVGLQFCILSKVFWPKESRSVNCYWWKFFTTYGSECEWGALITALQFILKLGRNTIVVTDWYKIDYTEDEDWSTDSKYNTLLINYPYNQHYNLTFRWLSWAKNKLIGNLINNLTLPIMNLIWKCEISLFILVFNQFAGCYSGLFCLLSWKWN